MNKKHTHFIGIGGIGMSGLAQILLQKGAKVTGSDLASSYVTEKMVRAGAEVYLGHDRSHVDHATRVIYNTDVPLENAEYQEALRKGIPILHRSDLLAELMEGTSTLLVTGTHGKTTTSSLLAHVLTLAGLDPSYAIGGMVHSLGTNAKYGRGNYFVAEACESDGTFLKYPNFGAIITNIDNDHLNFWKTEQALIEGFKQFAEKVTSKDHLFWCKDDLKLDSLRLNGTSYGFSEDASLRIYKSIQDGWKTIFSFVFEGKTYEEVEIPLIGKHNVLNAAAVFGLCLRLSLAEETIRAAFKAFQGVARRAEKKGEERSISIYDDYAHHPTEILATLLAMRAFAKDKRLVVVFQPHRYTRVKECMAQFADVFDHADELIVTDLYTAGETPIEGVTTEAVFETIKKRTVAKLKYVPRSQIVNYLTEFLVPHDIVLTMGAGDITKVGPLLITKLSPHGS